MKRLQKQVAEFVARHHLEAEVAHRLLDVVSELGEVAKEALKGSRYGRRRFARTKQWEAELGDVLFSLICVANTTHTDLEVAVRRALRKYARRAAGRGGIGSGRARRGR